MAHTVLRLLLIAAVAGHVLAQMPKPAASNMTMADDHAGHDHGDDHAGHDHDEPKTAQNGTAPMAHNGAAGGHSKMNMTMAKALPVPDSCVKDPKQSNCSSWDYPHANAANDLARLCGAMSFMAACSVQKACDKAGAGASGAPSGPGAAKVSSSNADVCKVFNHVATICTLDTGMSRMGGCENLKSMCVEGSPIPKCKLTGLKALPTTTALNTQVRAICDANPKAPGCADCAPDWEAGKKWANCDLLATYAKQCGADASLPQCVEYHNMCRADGSLSFCSGYNDAAKKVADSVLKNKGADPESQQATAAAAARSAAGSSSAASLSALALSAAAAAVLVL